MSHDRNSQVLLSLDKSLNTFEHTQNASLGWLCLIWQRPLRLSALFKILLIVSNPQIIPFPLQKTFFEQMKMLSEYPCTKIENQKLLADKALDSVPHHFPVSWNPYPALSFSSRLGGDCSSHSSAAHCDSHSQKENLLLGIGYPWIKVQWQLQEVIKSLPFFKKW